MYQRNIIASFPSRNDANWATRELLHAGLGEISLRILPPPSARRAEDGRVIVSAIVGSNHAHHAEEILGRYGTLDLADEDKSYWRASTRAVGRGASGMPDLPWGSIVTGGLAILAGWALISMRGSGQTQRSLFGSRSTGRREGFEPGVINTNKPSDIADLADLGWGEDTTPASVGRGGPARGGAQFQSGAPVRPPSTGEGLGPGSGLGSGSGLGAGAGAGSAAQGSGHIAGTDIGVGSGVGGRASGAGMAGRDLESAGQRRP